MTSVLYSFCSL